MKLSIKFKTLLNKKVAKINEDTNAGITIYKRVKLMKNMIVKIKNLLNFIEKKRIRKKICRKYGADLSIEHIKIYNNIDDVIINERKDKVHLLKKEDSKDEIIKSMLIYDLNLFMIKDKFIYCETWKHCE